jgi:hypothetical protein
MTCFEGATRFGLAVIDKCRGCGVPRLPLVGPALAGKSVCLGADCFCLRRVTWKSRKSHHPQAGAWLMRVKSVCLGADCFAFGELLGKAPSNQGPVLLVRPLVPRGSFTPVSLRGPAAIRHPWRGRLSRHPCRSAHSARPAFSLHPSLDWCRLNVMCMKIESRSTASRLKPLLQSVHIPLDVCDCLVGPALAGKRPAQAPTSLLIARLLCGSELARECSIQNTRSDGRTGPFVSKLTPTSS